jgi:hypothetical protein
MEHTVDTSESPDAGAHLQIRPKLRPSSQLARPLPKGAIARMTLLIMNDRSVEITIDGGVGLTLSHIEENLWAIYASIEEQHAMFRRELLLKEKKTGEPNAA